MSGDLASELVQQESNISPSTSQKEENMFGAALDSPTPNRLQLLLLCAIPLQLQSQCAWFMAINPDEG